MSERKENESIQLFLEKEALKSLSRAAEAKRRKQKDRTCFFAAFVLPSSAGVQVFHWRTQRSISICSRGFLVYEEKTTNNSLTFTWHEITVRRRRSRLWEEKLFALRFVSFFVCPREKESNWKKWSGQSSNHHQTKTGRPGRYPNRVLTARASLWIRRTTLVVRRKF